jgi:large subunit ribosomal protein L10
MNKEQKAAAVEEIAGQIQGADAVFAVDYRGISVPQAAELRTKLRDADARFRIVKNSLTERAADQAGEGYEHLKTMLEGPTALTFVHGDVALAAKAIADYGRATDLLAFKGGVMGGDPLDADQIRAIAKLPARDVLYGQLVGIVASPISGLVRTLNALIQGLALQLGQIAEKKQSGEIPAGEAPVAEVEPVAEAEAEAPEPEAVAEPEPVTEEEETVAEAEAPAAESTADTPEADASPDAEETDTDEAKED